MKKEDSLSIPSWIYGVEGIGSLYEAAVLAKIHSLTTASGMDTFFAADYLAELLVCTRRTITNVINKLIKKGLVTKGKTDYVCGVRRMHLSVTDKVRNALSEPSPDAIKEAAADIKEYVDSHDTIDPEELAVIASKRFVTDLPNNGDKKKNTKKVAAPKPAAPASSAKPTQSTTDTTDDRPSSPTPQTISQAPSQDKIPVESPQDPPHGGDSKTDDDDRQIKLDNWIRANEWDNLLRFSEPLTAAQYQRLKELEPVNDRINRKLAALDAKAASNPDYTKRSVYKTIKLWLANKDK